VTVLDLTDKHDWGFVITFRDSSILTGEFLEYYGNVLSGTVVQRSNKPDCTGMRAGEITVRRLVRENLCAHE